MRLCARAAAVTPVLAAVELEAVAADEVAVVREERVAARAVAAP
jgi:hypothetical protein